MDCKYCEGCPLDGRTQPVDTDDVETARFLVVTDTPNQKSARNNKAMSPEASSLFSKAMGKERFTRADFAFASQIRCYHNPDEYTTKEKKEIQSHCRNYLLDDIDAIQPKVILPLGAEASKQVIGRAVKISKVRGTAIQHESGAVVLPLLNPNQVLMYPQYQTSFASDCSTFGRLVDSDYDIAAAGPESSVGYEFVDDLQFLIDAKADLIAFDIEGTSLRWYDPHCKILTMQFSIEPGKAYMLSWDHTDAPQSQRSKARLKKQLIELLCREEVTVVGQNSKFDAVMLWMKVGIRMKIKADTLMLAVLLDENKYSHTQDDLVREYVPEMAGYADKFNATVDKSKMGEQPLDQNFLEYGCGDADSCLRLYNVIYPMVAADPQLLACYQRVSLPALNTFAAVETRGMLVDEEEIEQFEEFMKNKVEASYHSLLKQVPRSIKREHLEAKGKDALRFSRGDFIRDILFYHEDGFKLKPRMFTKTTTKLKDESLKIPSTSSKDHLPYFFDQCPFTFELAQYIKDERMLSTNIIGFRKKYVVDGMVRPTYSLHKAVTGRSNSSDPNGQNVPKRGEAAKAYRKIFFAPEGCYILEADLSQAELRIAADMANDPVMLQVYREGGDIHTETALIVKQMTRAVFDSLTKDDRDMARFRAKAVNFGFLFGMWWRKFLIYAKTQYGVAFTDREAQQIREEFFQKYCKLVELHEKLKAHARKHKQVRSYSGRIRHLPMIDSPEEWIRQEAERQAINSPIQEFASSLGLMSMARVEEEIDDTFLQLVSFVHDAIYGYVPQVYVEWGAKILKRYMQTNPIMDWFGIRMKVPIEADVSFGVSMGDMRELKGLKLDPPTLRGRQGSIYDFGKFWDVETDTGLIVPVQEIPPNDGRRIVSPYTEFAAAA